MELTKEHRALYTKLLRLGTGQPFIPDDGIRGLAILTAEEIQKALQNVNEPVPVSLTDLAQYASQLGDFFSESPQEWGLSLPMTPREAFGAIANCGVSDALLFFRSLAEIHRRRIRYQTILSSQPIPTMEQVGPRSLLEFGTADDTTLSAWLLWRKWFFDIDNRAGQETGYAFEPALAAALGGVPVSHKESPVRRANRDGGRQVDCLIDDDAEKSAYEFKLRVTIAASGQGRWSEELSFPGEARHSGFTPVLVVFDGTQNDKLTELCKAYAAANGKYFTGQDAWDHLEDTAGAVMGRFVEHYLRRPIEAVLAEEPKNRKAMPTVEVSMRANEIQVAIQGGNPKIIDRVGAPIP